MVSANSGGSVNKVPQARVDVRNVDLGSEILIYDERSNLVHILNATARRIWQLCDGAHRVTEIADEISRLFPQVPLEQVQRDVERALEDLVGKQIVIWSSDEAPAGSNAP